MAMLPNASRLSRLGWQVLAVAILTGAAAAGLPARHASAHPHGNWGSVYRSVDGGRIWEDLNRYDPVGTVYDLSAVHPPRLWEATDRGLRISDDYGNHWRPAGPAALGDVITVVAESPDNGSVIAGGKLGVFRAPANLSTWQRVLPASAGRPVSLTRTGQRALLGTTKGWLHSDDDGRTFHPGRGGLEAVNGRLVPGAGSAKMAGHAILSRGAVNGYDVYGTTDGAYVVSKGGTRRLVAGTESLDVWTVLAGPRAAQDGLLLGTRRGLLRLDPRRPENMKPEQDIPPFLAVGKLEESAARPGELYIATSINPYPTDIVPSGHRPGPAQALRLGLATGAAVLLVAVALLAGFSGRRRRSARKPVQSEPAEMS